MQKCKYLKIQLTTLFLLLFSTSSFAFEFECNKFTKPNKDYYKKSSTELKKEFKSKKDVEMYGYLNYELQKNGNLDFARQVYFALDKRKLDVKHKAIVQVMAFTSKMEIPNQFKKLDKNEFCDFVAKVKKTEP